MAPAAAVFTEQKPVKPKFPAGRQSDWTRTAYEEDKAVKLQKYRQELEAWKGRKKVREFFFLVT